ncbi:hypothetical protein F2P56_037007 [Juglans regia]|uniref:Endonuclease/exonuclease/phosphatase domain-containing protein n=2 Tax=Juglans regia TaxID=51240 RepID=A0A833TH21_JUGRE|nr:uncharacterized protein LOC109012240 [Juglans regia]KAF5441792.1 hypothetical protein F2P56_037007 [Juglans regia]
MIEPIFVWNIRGVGTSKVRLKKLIGKLKPKIVALLEPFQKLEVARRLALSLHFDNFLSNEVEGGKVWIFWDGSMKVNLIRMGEQFISLRVGEGFEKFLLTVIYAKCTRDDWRILWDELSAQYVGLDSCIFVGDFNIIRNDSEWHRGRPRPLGAMEDFNNWIQQGGLIEMASQGTAFSWCNGQHGLARSWARLDCVLLDVSFLSVFPNVIYSYLPRSASDHAPMCIEFKQDLFSYGPAPFLF